MRGLLRTYGLGMYGGCVDGCFVVDVDDRVNKYLLGIDPISFAFCRIMIFPICRHFESE